MAITLDFNIFWPGQEDLETQCTEFIEGTIGTPDKTTIVNEDESDPEAGYSLLFYYKDLSLNDFSFWDELYDFANETELYVIVYDHSTHIRKGYWYDEDSEWIEQEVGKQDSYLSNI
ncbi:hypothetical protein [Flavobacterium sp.]|uniref:hypothetical protein n=1 Tax=Flavobacterium sp. TaxID=239 RepID=UPI001B783B1D|nr:hypothetical protein [Flavobacterium sp.]MBP6126676.1 hypothetical protein [Flavobacterium sp.]